jgi:hypothetical protein
MGVKVSILLQYQRIFVPYANGERVTNWILRAAMFVVLVQNILFTILFIAACIPREDIWNELATGGRCVNTFAMLQAGGVINVLIDFGMLLFPLRFVWKLQMHKRHKYRLSAIFAVGLMYVRKKTVGQNHPLLPSWKFVLTLALAVVVLLPS